MYSIINHQQITGTYDNDNAVYFTLATSNSQIDKYREQL